MEEPVGMSIIGALLIVIGAGCLAGVIARIVLGGTALLTLAEIVLGIAGGWIVIFFLPMHGYALGNVIGWWFATVVGAVVPVLLIRVAVWR